MNMKPGKRDEKVCAFATSPPPPPPPPPQPTIIPFLRNVEACPVAIFLCRSDTSVLRFEKETPLKITDDIVAVAVITLTSAL
jgi:hypothetical protein